MGSVEINDVRGPEAFDQLIQLEQESTEIFYVLPTFFPGLLQVESYATAMIGGLAGLAPGDPALAKRVGVRMQRARAFASRLNGASPPRLWAVIDESVLRRLVGGPKVMREQIDHLIALSRLDTVTVAIVPFSQGAYPGLAGTIEVHQVAGGQGAAFLESEAGDELVGTDQDRVRHYRGQAESMLASAVSGAAATTLLDSISSSLS
jgi:Domain of unknown function (DUF5753)